MADFLKKSIAVVTSLALSLAFTPVAAFADPSEAVQDEQVEGESVQDIVSSDEGDVEVEENLVASGFQSAPEQTDSAALELDASEVIQYVYIESDTLAVGMEQSIAFALLDESVQIESATLTMTKDGSIEEMVDASLLQGNAGKFTVAFSGDEQIGSYRITCISYRINNIDQDIRAYFTNTRDGEDAAQLETDSDEFDEVSVTDGSAALSFEVVSQSVFDALTKTGGSDVTAMVLGDDGDIVATDSVAEALEIAQSVAGDDSQPVEQEYLSAQDENLSTAAAITNTREDYLIVAIDPGHGGSDGGAGDYGLRESDLTLSISNYLKSELDTYTGVTAYMTRTSDVYLGLQERVDMAKYRGADVFVCVHVNAGGGTGIEVWAPTYSSSYNSGARDEAHALANKMVSQLSALGLANRGVKTRDSESGSKYPDGSTADYLAVINRARTYNMPAVLAEHLFVDNASDAAKLADSGWLQRMGVADATAVASQYNLGRESTARSSALVQVQGHVDNIGWEDAVFDNKVAGTTGKNFSLQAFKVKLLNGAAGAGGIQYRSLVRGSWQNWVSNDAESGTTGQSTPIEALQLQLTGNAQSQYDVYYRAHVSNVGWMDWVKNGETAGSVGSGNHIEAMEVRLVEKGASSASGISYETHVENIGWQGSVSNGTTAGTEGQALRLEGIKIWLTGDKYSGGVEYETQVQDIGWAGTVSNGAMSGTEGQAKRLETIRMRLTGEIADHYDVYYRVHCQDFGWMDWASNWKDAGSVGCSKRLEAIEIKLVEKDKPAPRPTTSPNYEPKIGYNSHVENIGWQSEVYDGAEAGTTGQALRVEALRLRLVENNAGSSGSIKYSAHVQDYGWMNEVSNNAVAGTTGEAKRVEAFRIRLDGEIANHYDIYYRVHAQNIGWMGWAKNGEEAGTAGYAYRLEAIQIELVPRGKSGPSSDTAAFMQR